MLWAGEWIEWQIGLVLILLFERHRPQLWVMSSPVQLATTAPDSNLSQNFSLIVLMSVFVFSFFFHIFIYLSVGFSYWQWCLFTFLVRIANFFVAFANLLYVTYWPSSTQKSLISWIIRILTLFWYLDLSQKSRQCNKWSE